MSGGRPLPDLGIGTTQFRPRGRSVVAARGAAAAAAPELAARAEPAAAADAAHAASQMALVARIDRLRGQLTAVVAELRALEKHARRGVPSPAEAAQAARLRSEETRLHREIVGVRTDLARLRGVRSGQ